VALAGCDPKTVQRYVAPPDAGGGDPLVRAVGPRPKLIDAFLSKVEELVDTSRGRGQAPAQAFVALVEGLIDGLVAQVPVRSVRELLPQVARDLFRAPLQQQLGLDLHAQLLVDQQARSARPPRALSGACVGQVAVVDALVMVEGVAA
jgi:hypothetical protein